MKRFLKNKKIIFIISIIFFCALYFIVNKSINNYNDDDFIENVEENNTNEIAKEEKDYVEKNYIEENDEYDEENNLEESEDNEKIYIYVTGEVNIPGIVILDKGSRIIDAIDAAGGTTDRADTSKINLAYILEDGTKVSIPNQSDLKNNTSFKYIITDSSENGDNENYKQESNTYKENASVKKNTVNINTATQTELETLPGIGPSIALKIINYRIENGKFKSIEDIKNISGIGDSKFENLKRYITV